MKAQIQQNTRANPAHDTSVPIDPSMMRLPPDTNGGASQNENYPQINLEELDLFSTDNISEAWYGQQLINLDWLEIPQQLYGQ